jgi:hypothetical protein
VVQRGMIADFEAGIRHPNETTLTAIRIALEAALRRAAQSARSWEVSVARRSVTR